MSVQVVKTLVCDQPGCSIEVVAAPGWTSYALRLTANDLGWSTDRRSLLEDGRTRDYCNLHHSAELRRVDDERRALVASLEFASRPIESFP